MVKRPAIAVGIIAGMAWALLLVWCPIWAGLPYIAAPVALPTALFAPGLVMALMIAKLAIHRFLDSQNIYQDPSPGGKHWIDQRVLSDTTEHLILCLITWPFIAVSLGGALVIAMGVGFAIARLLFWLGYRISLPLRAFGFSATFSPTILAIIWSIIAWVK